MRHDAWRGYAEPHAIVDACSAKLTSRCHGGRGPRGFVALMSLYESNYLRFLQLAGDPTRLSGTLISRVDGDCELRLAVLEHMPYTSMLTLTYLLPSSDSGCSSGCRTCRLRAYHDARLLEAEQFRQQQPRT